MTLSPTERGLQQTPLAPWRHLTMDSDITFAIGPEAPPVEAVARAQAFARRTLPMLLKGESSADATSRDVLALVTELIDITARHRCSTDILGRIVFDGIHVIVSVGEMRGPLPAPEEEPGLYLVHRLVDDLGQYRGDEGGYTTWASVPIRSSAQ
ncbi:hypothetical protein ACFV98_02470 [Streptomyces violascens]|uniref:hypothetical protein n=1 Tax=Streptomyces violascens TaxID=67381 RepID=UPI00364B12F2